MILRIYSQAGHASSSTSSSSDTHSSLSELLEYFSSSVIDDFDSWITTEMEIWPRAMQFYKTAKVKEKRLRGRLCIEYADDDGVDAGALCGDFLEKLMIAVDEKLFEGNSFRRTGGWNSSLRLVA